MRRPGVDPSDALLNDVVCDFCFRDWDLAQPVYEGKGLACICMSCLGVAHGHLFGLGLRDAPPTWTCNLCGEFRPGTAWPGVFNPRAIICGRCVKRAVRKMKADPDSGWGKPRFRQDQI